MVDRQRIFSNARLARITHLVFTIAQLCHVNADQSAIEAINRLDEKYLRAGKTLHLRHLSADCVRMIRRAEKICEVNVLEDPNYFVAIDTYKASDKAKERAAAALSGELVLKH